MPPKDAVAASDPALTAMERLLDLNRKGGQAPAPPPVRARRRPKRRAEGPAEPGVQPVPLDRISPNPDQPRQAFDDAAIDELAESLRTQGVIQPLLVRPHPEEEGRFQIVAGERRFIAAGRAGLEAVPCIVRELDDRQTFILSVAENVAREALNPLDEAAAYRRMLDERYVANQGEIAGFVGIHRTRVSRKLKLLKLDPRIQDHIRSEPAAALSQTHLEELSRLEAGDQQYELYRAAVARGLSTRELQARVQAVLAPPRRHRARVARNTIELEDGARLVVYPSKVTLSIPRQAGEAVDLARVAARLEAVAAELRARLPQTHG